MSYTEYTQAEIDAHPRKIPSLGHLVYKWIVDNFTAKRVETYPETTDEHGYMCVYETEYNENYYPNWENDDYYMKTDDMYDTEQDALYEANKRILAEIERLMVLKHLNERKIFNV